MQVGIKWAKRAIVALLSLAGVGGVGWMGVQVVLVKPASAADMSVRFEKNDIEHGNILTTQKADHALTVANDTAVKALTQEVGGIKNILSKDVARKEAHRLTDEIRDRRRAAFEYDRIFEINLRRLAAGKDPCGTLACD